MDSFSTYAVLTAEEMRGCDRLTIESGTSGFTLMQRAASAVADSIIYHYSFCPVVVVCGMGNNGGDGMVVATLLQQQGWPVRVALLGDHHKLEGDAKLACDMWQEAGGAISSPLSLSGASLVVDALFGFGLNRPLEKNARQWIQTINDSKLPVVSIDIPSGVNADTGQVMGAAVNATETITFFRGKPGLYLQPGRMQAGNVTVMDIGISSMTLAKVKPTLAVNTPSLWDHYLPKHPEDAHKYDRGAVLIAGGPQDCTGAARLAALSAARSGAGLVAVACDSASLPVYAASLLSVMTRRCDDVQAFDLLLQDKKYKSIVLGPGHGTGERTHHFMEAALESGKPLVLDADAVTCLSGNRAALFTKLHDKCVLTPHEGEFARLFDSEGSKADRAITAAKETGSIIVLKGSDTVIAHPKGYAVINTNAPPSLATAGSGDVLSGLIGGLMAQGVRPFEAACAAVWVHGESGNRLSGALLAEDLPMVAGQILTGFE